MRTIDFNALPELAALLKAGGWIICKYEALNIESAVLTITRNEKAQGAEDENGNH